VGDGLAWPISFEARYGAGHDRTLVLGGGGVVFVAWLTGYLGELSHLGVDVAAADRIVGTSAGSLLAGVVAAGHLNRVGRVLRLLAGRPALISRLAPAGEFYYAEPYHQQYLEANPNGYCGLGGTGVSCPVGLAEAG